MFITIITFINSASDATCEKKEKFCFIKSHDIQFTGYWVKQAKPKV